MKNTVDFKNFSSKMKAGIALYGQTAGAMLESKAKAGRPWTDRTTNARNSIQGGFEWKGYNARVVLSGNVDYFPALELARMKKYAILSPTMESMTNEILKGFVKVVGG